MIFSCINYHIYQGKGGKKEGYREISSIYFIEIRWYNYQYFIILLTIFQLIALAQRRRPPPDLDLIEDGFVLTEEESKERRLTKQIINRRSKKVVIPPPVLSEEEFVQRCREEASNMLLGVRSKIILFFLAWKIPKIATLEDWKNPKSLFSAYWKTNRTRQ